MSAILLPSYGRRRGRKLRSGRSGLMESLLPKLLINIPPASSCAKTQDLRQSALAWDPAVKPQDDDLDDLKGLFPHPERPLWFELGFGAGEHLAEQARQHPEINFIGCEPYINGVATLLSAIDHHKLTNIRLSDGDARLILGQLPDASIERLFVLFPDPWPKARHHKRRIISQPTLALFYSKLKPGGLLRLATDHVDYGTWMLEQLLAFGKFEWTAKKQADWETPPPDWIRTRYQAKAEAEGRGALFLDWVKTHPNACPSSHV